MIYNKYKKEDFKNVYFVTGTATGGKTTISKAIAEKYGFIRYDVDVEFNRHLKLSNPIDQPNMNKQFNNADDFFMRSKEEYVDWLINNTYEQLPFVLEDLVKLSKNHTIVCDLHIQPEDARQLCDNDKVVFLIRENNDNIIDDYCNRKDHVGFKNYINSASNPTRAKQNCNEVLRQINTQRCNEIKNSEFLYIERNELSTVEKTLEIVEKHFHLSDK